MYNDTENFIPPIDTDISEKYNFAPERKENVGIVHHHRNILIDIFNTLEQRSSK